MTRLRIALVLATLLTMNFVTTVNAQDKPKRNFLSALKEGQTISVKEVAGRYEISVLKKVPVGHKVLEVGNDYILVEDPASVSELRIPVYSIKSIVTLKVPKE